MKSLYLFCYDISDENRLNKMYRYMKGKGIHLQYSVFYCELDKNQLHEMIQDISKIIHPRYDDVRIYSLSKDSLVEVLGVGDRIPEGVEIYFD